MYEIPQLFYFPSDLDVWMGTSKLSDGSECYKYIFLYTDYALVVIKNIERILQQDLI